jgi:DNA polymerase delta subunit 1
MEKYLKPLILYKKKKYVGVAYEEVGKEGKTLARGLELERRDAVPIVRTCQASVIDALLLRESPSEAVLCVKDAVERVMALPVGGPFASIVLSKSLRTNYSNPDGMPHVKVAALMNERDAGSAPRVGDRVEYVVIASESKRIVDKVDDVGYAEAQRLPPDWHHYVEALERPLLRVLEVPLRSIDPAMYHDLMTFLSDKKTKALALRKTHSMARHGSTWVDGHTRP